MSRQEKELQEIRAFAATIRGDKEKSLTLLVEAGILTKSGKLTKPYKNLCIPTVAD